MLVLALPQYKGFKKHALSLPEVCVCVTWQCIFRCFCGVALLYLVLVYVSMSMRLCPVASACVSLQLCHCDSVLVSVPLCVRLCVCVPVCVALCVFRCEPWCVCVRVGRKHCSPFKAAFAAFTITDGYF